MDARTGLKINLLALLRRERIEVRVALLVAATLILSLSACERSDKSDGGRETTFSAKADSSPSERGLSPFPSPKKLLSIGIASHPSHELPPEEPAWLAEARNDPDPKSRLDAIETWARNPGESLDPVTHALVDPDERVRARAQELLEEALVRR